MPSSIYPTPQIQEVLDHLANATDSHDASAVSFVPAGTIAATDVQAAIEEVASEGGGGAHATDHEDGGADELEIADLATAEADTALVLHPDGAGGVAWGADATGGGEAFPVGSVFLAVVATNPGTLLGYGTWSAFGAGRMLVGFDSGDTDFDTVEETGGAKTVTLTSAEMPAHTHEQIAPSSASGGSGRFAVDTNSNGAVTDPNATGSTGSGGAHNNVPPYIVVHMWKRTA